MSQTEYEPVVRPADATKFDLKNACVLALDLGATTGWATRAPDTLEIRCGSWSLEPKRGEGYGMRFVRLRSLLDEANKAGASRGIAAVFFEWVSGHKSLYAAHLYGGYVATVQAWCEQHDIVYGVLSVGEIKRHATDKWRASKREMMNAARKRWPDAAFRDDNQVDAMWLLDAVLHPKVTLAFAE